MASPRPVRLIHLAADRRFVLEPFEALLHGRRGMAPVDTRERELHWVAQLLRGVPHGGRHEAAKRLAGHLIGRGESPEATLELLRGWALRCDPPWTEPGEDEELADIVAWVRKEEAEKRRGYAPPPCQADANQIQGYGQGVGEDQRAD